MPEAPKSQKRIEFESNRKDYTEKDIQMEILYTNWLTYEAAEKTRGNTNTIVWIIVVSGVLSLIVGAFSLA